MDPRSDHCLSFSATRFVLPPQRSFTWEARVRIALIIT